MHKVLCVSVLSFLFLALCSNACFASSLSRQSTLYPVYITAEDDEGESADASQESGADSDLPSTNIFALVVCAILGLGICLLFLRKPSGKR